MKSMTTSPVTNDKKRKKSVVKEAMRLFSFRQNTKQSDFKRSDTNKKTKRGIKENNKGRTPSIDDERVGGNGEHEEASTNVLSSDSSSYLEGKEETDEMKTKKMMMRDQEENEVTGGGDLDFRLHFERFQSFDELRDFLLNCPATAPYIAKMKNGELSSLSSLISVTGGGAHRLEKRFLETFGCNKVLKVGEMKSLIVGLNFLLENSFNEEVFNYDSDEHCQVFIPTTHEHSYPYLLVNVGSGTSIIKVTGTQEYQRVSGSTIGGGTYLGLCRLLTHLDSFEEISKVEKSGRVAAVDLLVKDIYGDGSKALGLKADTIASSFGKVPRSDAKFHPSDITKSLLIMICNTLAQIGYLREREHISTMPKRARGGGMNQIDRMNQGLSKNVRKHDHHNGGYGGGGRGGGGSHGGGAMNAEKRAKLAGKLQKKAGLELVSSNKPKFLQRIEDELAGERKASFAKRQQIHQNRSTSEKMQHLINDDVKMFDKDGNPLSEEQISKMIQRSDQMREAAKERQKHKDEINRATIDKMMKKKPKEKKNTMLQKKLKNLKTKKSKSMLSFSNEDSDEEESD
eukprot:g423.t1